MSEQETIEKNRIECELRTKELYKDKTVYKWRMVFKSAPYGVSAESKYDLQTRRRYTDISNKGYHDFTGTHESSDKVYKEFRLAGYCIQDCYNLGEYIK
tara:strand:+ start:860 stop:1156 length:297 start_codon:yes stop_codon:yes gene_type:complete